MWSRDSKSYAGDSVATGRAFHAGQVEKNDPEKKTNPGRQGGGGVVKNTLRVKINIKGKPGKI